MGEPPEIECPQCDGEGHLGQPRNLCLSCFGEGWRAMTQDEIDDAAADAWSDLCEREPPITMQERHEAAWRQKQELKR